MTIVHEEPKQVPGWRKLRGIVAFWSIWLVLEFEFLLVTNYPIRTELRALFGLPLYHILLSFLTLAALVRWMSPEMSLPWRSIRISAKWAACHFALYCSLAANFESVWAWSQRLGSTMIVAACSLWAWALLGTWLLSWLPFREWRTFFTSQANWLGWVVPTSLAAPYIAEYASSWWYGFASFTFELATEALHLFYDDVFCDPESLRLGTGAFTIEILPGCSGYEGMGLIFTLVVSYLWVRRKFLQFPKALLLLPSSMVLAYFANIIRLVLIIMIGSELSPSVAIRGFHSQAGWLSFTVLGFVMIYLAELSGLFLNTPQQEPGQYDYPALPYLAPMAGLLFSTMLVEGSSGLFQYSYPLKPLVGMCLLLYFASHFRPLLKKVTWEGPLVGISVYALWVALVTRGDAVSPYAALSQPWIILWLVCRVFGAVLVVPVCEELAFRGYLFRRIQQADFESASSPTALAYLLSSLAFGLLHSDVLAGFFAGLAYAWVSTRRGGLLNAVIAHAVTNGALAIQVLIYGDWWLW